MTFDQTNVRRRVFPIHNRDKDLLVAAGWNDAANGPEFRRKLRGSSHEVCAVRALLGKLDLVDELPKLVLDEEEVTSLPLTGQAHQRLFALLSSGCRCITEVADARTRAEKIQGPVHAEFVATEHGVRVRELGSRNGIFAGGVRVGEVFLLAACKLRLGETEISFEPVRPEKIVVPNIPAFGPLVAQSAGMHSIFEKISKVVQYGHVPQRSLFSRGAGSNRASCASTTAGRHPGSGASHARGFGYRGCVRARQQLDARPGFIRPLRAHSLLLKPIFRSVAALVGLLLTIRTLSGCLGDLKVQPPEGAGGSGGSMGCTPDKVSDCTTNQLGACSLGMRICTADGLSQSVCVPKNSPKFDDCRTPDDDDCDGDPIAECTGTTIAWFTPSGNAPLPNDDAILASSAAIDGGFVVGGVVDGNVDNFDVVVNAGKIYVAKLDPAAQPSWARTYASTNTAAARSVAVDVAGNIVVAGEFSGNLTLGQTTLVSAGSSDIVVFKLDASGTPLWARRFGGGKFDAAWGITTDTVGNIYVTGRLQDSTIDLGGGAVNVVGDDAFLLSLDPDGNHRWSRIFVNAGSQFGRGLAITNGGALVLVGESDSSFNLGGASISNGGGVDCFVARFTSQTGAHQWSRASITAGDQSARAVAAPNGEIALTGRFQGSVNFGGTPLVAQGNFDTFLVKLNDDGGELVRAARFGGTGRVLGNSLAVDGAGHIVLVGAFDTAVDWGGINSVPLNGLDAFVVKLSADSWSPLWARRFQGQSGQFAMAAVAGPKGRVLAAGGFDSDIELGGGVGKVSTTGGTDMFTVLLAP